MTSSFRARWTTSTCQGKAATFSSRPRMHLLGDSCGRCFKITEGIKSRILHHVTFSSLRTRNTDAGNYQPLEALYTQELSDLHSKVRLSGKRSLSWTSGGTVETASPPSPLLSHAGASASVTASELHSPFPCTSWSCACWIATVIGIITQ